MYLPPVFQEPDVERCEALVDAYPFGTLVLADGDDVEIAHLPFLLERSAAGRPARLLAHVARANPVAARIAVGHPVRVVFHGPHGYVSPTWYAHPDRQVPTWNYAVVHATGTFEAPLGRPELRALLAGLAARHEPGPAPWTPARLEPALYEALLDGIVGLAVRVSGLVGKLKLSQNRSDEDQGRVVAALRARGDEEMLRWMPAARGEPT